jgi:hypothetical protein
MHFQHPRLSRYASVCIFILVYTLSAAATAHAGALQRLFAPKAKLWQVWTANQPDSALSIDHGSWAGFLRQYVTPGEDGINRVAYAGVTTADRSALAAYIAEMEAIPVSRYARDQQLAYWINLYNAVTVDVVLRHYPVSSIRDVDISRGLFAKGPWGRKLLSIEGESVSLNDIEHRILRPIWQDPRIHYGLNCASLGCPNLPVRAFTADNYDELLDQGARKYVNHARGAHIRDGSLVVSSLYEWFKSDFGGSDAAVIMHLRRYADGPLAESLQEIDEIADDSYDWALNDAAP